MIALQTGGPPWAVFGVPEVKPVLNAPPGRQKVKLRAKSFGLLHVLTPDGIRRFTLKVVDDHWEPFHEIGRNVRRAV